MIVPGLAGPNPSSAQRFPSSHLLAGALIFGLVLMAGFIYRATLGSLIEQWLTQETYAHGLLIAPASCWLIWRERDRLRTLPARPLWIALWLPALLGWVWLLGELADVNSVRQFAVVLMPAAFVAAVAGTAITRQLGFALAYLAFAVPFGEFLVPAMMAHTAEITIWALRATGIPVWREGLNFVLPSGRWSVVEACSGLRYVIASVTIGTLYAWLAYRSTARRFAFIALSVVVPIVANWIRAYLIVMLGHLSGMKLAAGIDHLIYGWLFFGLVMALLFALGARWREPESGISAQGDVSASSDDAPAQRRDYPGSSSRSMALVSLLCVALVAPWPAIAAALKSAGRTASNPISGIETAIDQRFRTLGAAAFQPAFRGGNNVIERSIAVIPGQAPVSLSIRSYVDPTRDGEMIGDGQTVARPGDARVAIVSVSTLDTMPATEWRLRIDGEMHLAWHWYEIAGHRTHSNVVGKLWTAYALLGGQGAASVSNTVSTPTGSDESAARERLQALVSALDQAQQRGGAR